MSLSSPSARGTLWAASLGFVVVLLDVSVVNVALDALRHEFATDVAGLQWVLNAYTLVFAALLLTSGALGDRFGARRIFLQGFVVFTLASAACGMASSLSMLVVARLVQGLGAALLVPNSLAMLQRAFPDREQRSRAVGWWGAFGSMSLAAGPVLGGVLVTHLGWHSIFLINLPIGLIGICLTLRHVAPHGGSHRRSLDWGGQDQRDAFVGGCFAYGDCLRRAQFRAPGRRHVGRGRLRLSDPGYRAAGLHARHACVDWHFGGIAVVRNYSVLAGPSDQIAPRLDDATASATTFVPILERSADLLMRLKPRHAPKRRWPKKWASLPVRMASGCSRHRGG